jgi:CBS domain containing-hemolysin-like protein
MKLLIFACSAALALLSISLLKVYKHVPERELKRRAREGDELAAALYKAAAYGPSLGAVLWFLVGLTNATFFFLISRDAPAWLAIGLSALLIWLSFVWLPARKVTHVGARLAAWIAPGLAWLLNYIHPLLDLAVRLVQKHLPVTIHTGLYDRQDLLDMLEFQRVQPDNRIEELELEIALHALTFGDRLIQGVMTPRRVVKVVSADETIGPVMMTELHASGHSRFPVYEGKKDNIVGMVFMRDLVGAKAGQSIKHAMRPEAHYVHEEQPLSDALQAILKTHSQLFIVVNSFEEYVGIITIEDILEQVVGQPIIDEFDQYDDLRAVAARAARKEHKEHEEPEKPTDAETEVVE